MCRARFMALAVLLSVALAPAATVGADASKGTTEKATPVSSRASGAEQAARAKATPPKQAKENAKGQKPVRQAAVQPSAPLPSGPVLRVAVEGAYPPFSEVDGKGRLKGFDIDIANALCAELAMRCQFVQRPWAVIQDAVIGEDLRLWNEVDAIVASVSITDTRRQTADFTQKYFHSPGRFLRRTGSGVDPERLRGRRIGVQASTTYDEFATLRFANEAQIVRFETLPQALAALKEGRIDLVLADSLALQRAVLEGKDKALFELCGPAFTDARWFGYGAGIVVRKGNRELLAKLDAALERLKAKGEHARIAKAYFGFDVDPR